MKSLWESKAADVFEGIQEDLDAQIKSQVEIDVRRDVNITIEDGIAGCWTLWNSRFGELYGAPFHVSRAIKMELKRDAAP